jgi:hypothetical protein
MSFGWHTRQLQQQQKKSKSVPLPMTTDDTIESIIKQVKAITPKPTLIRNSKSSKSISRPVTTSGHPKKTIATASFAIIEKYDTLDEDKKSKVRFTEKDSEEKKERPY